MTPLRNLLLSAGVLLLASCSEKGPKINFDNNTIVDTTYLSGAETAAEKHVLVEEFTGVKCSNCPTGHLVLKNFADQYPGRLSILGYQVYGNDQTKPIEGTGEHRTRTDNRNEEATQVGNAIFGGVPALPVAAIDRSPVAGSLLGNRTVWAGAVADRMAKAAPVNLTITSSYDNATRQATVKVRAAYTAAVAGKQRLTLALSESGIVDAQESTDTVYFEYDHEHVLRDFMTSPEGDPVLDKLASKEVGRVYERTFVFLLNSAWKPENCSLVAFVHQAEGTNKEILQSAEVKLK